MWKWLSLLGRVAAISAVASGPSTAGGWVLGDGANLNGVPLNETLKGFGDRIVWSFSTGADSHHEVSSVDLIRGGPTVEIAPTTLRRSLEAMRNEHGLKNARFITLWLTPGWQPKWFPPKELQSALDAGVTPVFLDWFFGDGLLQGDPRTDVPSLVDAYADHSRRFGRFLGQFDGDILVVVEPELNKPAIEQWPEFGEIIRTQGIEEIRRGVEEINAATGRETTVFFGVALTDNGLRGADQEDPEYGTKAQGDSYGWTLSRPLLEVLRPDLDFVGFQQILPQFHRDPAMPDRPVGNSAESIGLPSFAERLLNYARYLDAQLGIPVFIPYVGLPTSTWEDADGDGMIGSEEVQVLGWTEEVGSVLLQIASIRNELRDAGVIGIGIMSVFDDPVHDLGGYQYLLENEYALGMVETNAQAGVAGQTFGSTLTLKRAGGKSLLNLFFGE